MASLNQTIVLNADVFPLGSAINKTFQKTVTINGNSTVFGTLSLLPGSAAEIIEISTINNRAIVFLEANANNGSDKINVGLYNPNGITGVASAFVATTQTFGAYTPDESWAFAVNGDMFVEVFSNNVGNLEMFSVQVNLGGSGHTVGETFTVSGQFFGSTAPDPADDVTFTITNVTTLPSFDTIIQLAAGDIALLPYKYSPQVAPAVMPKLAVKIDASATGPAARLVNFSVLETA